MNWINEVVPYEDAPTITLEDANIDRPVYLINDEDADIPETVECWIKLNHKILFENELAGW